ncbi:uncharacterized protein LOC122849557 isoform X2 [Aphidius gifuensis]|uniref:uncharacterized protein LOC122849557 isoform X2 n=1 Tax=Aphidius gifuensis TaxID=684658 RepID=UPI001CDC1940|nr:uncharacterized protein LOC122849557 isoform X2 [Aphidius gifuensis]
MRGKYFICVIILLSMMKIVISSSIANEAINVINIISNTSANAIANKNDTLINKKIYSIWTTINQFELKLYKLNKSIDYIIPVDQYVDMINKNKIENFFHRIFFLLEKTEQWSRLLIRNKPLNLKEQTLKMISDDADFPKSLIVQIYKIIFERIRIFTFSQNNYEFIKKDTVFKCDTSITQQHELYSFYNDIISLEIQVCGILAFSYTWRSINVPFNYTDEMIVEMDESKNRIKEYTNLFKNKMKKATNIIRPCDPSEKRVKGKTYEAFDNIIWIFIANQRNFEPRNNVQCQSSCENMSRKKRFCEIQNDDCSVDNHDYDDTCPGWSFACTDALSTQVEACRRDPDDKSSAKPYHWFKNLDNGNSYGNTSRKCGSTEIIKAERVNCLLWSETSNNMVATGVRLVARDRMIHIQLREGKLLPYGIIDKNTERWIPLPKFEYDDNFPATAIYSNGTRHSLERTIDFAPIQSFYMDKICLQKLIFNEGQLLTGARFNLDHLKDRTPISCIALDVKYASFQYQYGNITASTNYKKQLPKPTKFVSRDHQDAIILEENFQDSEENQFVEFATSDWRTDASQTTIPFFDLQDVATDPGVPLSGIELFYKEPLNKTPEGYVSFKIYPLNFTTYMDL